jgi:hypothetical protein
MKRSILHATYAVALIAASLYGGWWLGKFISSFPFEFPLWLLEMIEAGMHAAGAPDPLDPEIIEIFGLMTLFVACCIVVAIALGIALFLLRRYLKKRRAS